MLNKKEIFHQRIKEIYPDDFEDVLDFLTKPRAQSFRVNTLLAEEKEIIQNLVNLGFEVKVGPFENFYFVDVGARRLSETEFFANSQIYMQEFSSMLPVLALGARQNDKILDICASPGSKTTQLSSLTKNKTSITCIEKNKNRYFHLKRNLSQNGVVNVDALHENAVGFYKRHPEFVEYFDKIIADVPCSNEAGINPNFPKTLELWNPKKIKALSKLQKGILQSAVEMLKPGGTLIYSTCTFEPDEDEVVLDWILRKYPNLKITRIDSLQILPNKKEGITFWNNKNLNSQVQNIMRILPTDTFTGFTLAKIIKEF